MAKKLNVGMKCIKHMIFISNVMFVLIGILLIAIGATIHEVYSDFETFIESHHFKPAAFSIAVGVVILSVSLFGCIGAYRESTCLINVYAIFLLLLLILEVASAIVAFAVRSDIYDRISENMFDTMKQYSACEPARESWDFMQQRIFCCGVHHPFDWAPYNVTGPEISLEDGGRIKIPYSCCNVENCADGKVFATGCFDILADYVYDSSLMIAYGAISVAIVQLLGVVFAFMLAQSIRRVKTEREIRRQRARQVLYEQLARDQVPKTPTPALYIPQATDA